mgnify:CR=1 FL=1
MKRQDEEDAVAAQQAATDDFVFVGGLVSGVIKGCILAV